MDSSSNYVEWDSISDKFTQCGLSVFHINARSLSNKFCELTAHLSMVSKKFSFIIITECWLSERSDVGFEIPGYKSFGIYRNNRRGGGIKLYYLNTLVADIVSEVTGCFDSYESLAIKVSVPGIGKLLVCGIYRVPGTSENLFIENLFDLLNFTNSYRSIIGGDFNLNILQNPLSCATRNYIQLLNSFGYENFIDKNTYVSPGSFEDVSCLDHIWSNFDTDIATGYIIKPNLSDHYAICAIYNRYNLDKSISIKFRNFSEENIENFNRSLDQEFSRFDPSGHASNVDSYAYYITNFLSKLTNKYFPKMTKQLSQKRLKSPWLSDIIVRCINKKHTWYRLLKRHRITRRSYNEYCKALRNLLDIAEREYYRHKFNTLNNDPKQNWKVLNYLLGKTGDGISDSFNIDGMLVNCEKTIAKSFSDHFLNHPISIHGNIPDSTMDFSNLITSNPRGMVFNYATETELHSAISKSKKGGSIDDIPDVVLKNSKHYLARYLSELFNMCVDQGDYPRSFKISRITPIHKKGCRKLISNYRPISTVCNLSKIFDSLVYKRILSFFNKYNLLSKNQFGFRKNKNTELAILELINKIMPAIKNQSYCICVFLDYKACFDTISREILLSKIEKYGVRGVGLEFIRAYFTNRKQYVSFKSSHSQVETQQIGVIQGCKTGPLFFDIYCNEFQSVLGDDHYILYADDTSIVYVGDDLPELVSHINSKLKIVSEWCRFNQLSLNPEKSEFMLITNKNVNFSPVISIGNSSVRRVDCVKYLGMFVDEKMKFGNQIDHVESRLSSYCGVSYRLKGHFNRETALKFYWSCVYSVISYCLATWGGVSVCSQRCRRIERLHRRVVKNLFSKYFSQSQDIFKSTNLLKFSDIYRFRAACYMFKVVRLNSIPSLENSLNLTLPDHSHETRYRNLFLLPFPRVECIRYSFHYQFGKIWNDIPERIKGATSLGIFKNLLTEFYISVY